MGLNRTFMELKYLIKKRLIIITHSLNRTFMELKSNKGLRVSYWKESQSYLYGIEIGAAIVCRGEEAVSIVPLWN